MVCKWLIDGYLVINKAEKIMNLCEQDEKDMPCNRYTALQIAACRGHAGVVKLLLMSGASSKITDVKKRSAILNAISRGYIDVAQEFYDQGIWLNKSERTDLLELAEKGDKAVEVCLAIPLMNLQNAIEISQVTQEVSDHIPAIKM